LPFGERHISGPAFRRERLRTAVTRLRDRLQEVKRQEKNERRWIAYEKAKAERDKLAAELKEFYPSFEKKLSDLLYRIDVNDKEIERINDRARPMGADRLLVAELAARNLEGFASKSGEVPRITKILRVPAFRFDRHDPYAWPRER
jgi:hypothetical protein